MPVDSYLLSAFIDSLAEVSAVVAAGLGYIGVGIILYGALKGFIEFALNIFSKTGHIPHIRIELAKHLSLGLEFLVGKDIIGMVVNPSWDELGKLGAIIVLRTFIALFLEYELKKMQERIVTTGINK